MLVGAFAVSICILLGNSVMASVCWAGVLLGAFVNSNGSLIGASVVRGLPMLGAIEKNSPAGLPVPSAGLTVTGLPVPYAALPVPPARLPMLLFTGVLVNTSSTGAEVGVGITGAMEGGDVTGRQPVFAQHFMSSGHSVSLAVMQGWWHFSFTSSQPVPHQYECRGSSAGITGGEVGDTVTGAPVIVGDAVIVGDIVVGAKLDGESDGMCVNPIVGLNVISEALHPIPP
jgi:hypothetical protein